MLIDCGSKVLNLWGKRPWIVLVQELLIQWYVTLRSDTHVKKVIPKKCSVHPAWYVRDTEIPRVAKLIRHLAKTKAQIPLVASRYDTTRYLAHVFWNRKKSWRAVSRLLDSKARQARHDERDSHDVFRGVATAWTGVDMSTSLFQKLFLRLIQIQSTKD